MARFDQWVWPIRTILMEIINRLQVADVFLGRCWPVIWSHFDGCQGCQATKKNELVGSAYSSLFLTNTSFCDEDQWEIHCNSHTWHKCVVQLAQATRSLGFWLSFLFGNLRLFLVVYCWLFGLGTKVEIPPDFSFGQIMVFCPILKTLANQLTARLSIIKTCEKRIDLFL